MKSSVTKVFRKKLDELPASVQEHVRAWSEKHGVTQAVIEQEIAKLISDANNLS